LPAEVLALARRLRTIGEWELLRRAERAFKLGQADLEVLPLAEEGGAAYEGSAPKIAGAKNVTYCVLRPRGGGASFATRSRERYAIACKIGTDLAPDSVNRAFPSDEAEIYFLGAGRQTQWQ